MAWNAVRPISGSCNVRGEGSVLAVMLDLYKMQLPGALSSLYISTKYSRKTAVLPHTAVHILQLAHVCFTATSSFESHLVQI